MTKEKKKISSNEEFVGGFLQGNFVLLGVKEPGNDLTQFDTSKVSVVRHILHIPTHFL